MIARSLKHVAEACSGWIVRGAAEHVVRRVCSDSRRVEVGDLFVALAGEHYDAHNFLADVAQKGASAVLVRSGCKINGLACGVVEVADTRVALGQLAAAHRKDFSIPVIAIAGSNGKTTTKELVAAVLRQRLVTLWSEASFNNDIGVPLTLLRLEGTHQAAVLEVGTNHPGELAPLVKLIRPTLGVITNIGREHLEFFGDLAGVAQEEGMLAELLPREGKLFLSGDDLFAPALGARTKASVVRVGAGKSNDWTVKSIRLVKDGTVFQVTAPEASFNGEYKTSLLGRHQAVNALFAIALGAELGLSREEIQRGLAECQPAKMRLQLSEVNGVFVLDDAYNANADSVGVALETLMELPCKGRRVAVLGDMAELGAETEIAHQEIGRRAAELGVGQLITVGKMAGVTAQAARAAGLGRVLEFMDVEMAADAVRHVVKPGDMVLLKASRVSRLERISELLRGAEAVLKN